MRLRRLRRNGWAAWLGVAALVLNALVPVHIAFDLADAFAPATHEHSAAGDDLQRRLLAALTGHSEPAHDHDNDHHHRPDCPVCSSLGALGGLAPPAHPVLSVALPVAAAPLASAIAEWRDGAAVAAYRSRAPPIA